MTSKLGIPTKEQLIGSDPNFSSWVTASAGTGKTQVLTDRVLRLLISGARPEGILCLTFTKAAAAEMKSRVIGSLSRWAQASESELNKELKHLQSGNEISQKDRDFARGILSKVIDSTSGIPIQTIHSFCQSLLNRFPIESGIASSFQVADKSKSMAMLNDSLESILNFAYSGNAELEHAINILSSRFSELEFQKLISEINDHRSHLKKILLNGFTSAEDNFRAALGLKIDDTEESISCAGCLNIAFNGSSLRESAEAMINGSITDKKNGETIIDWLDASESDRKQNLWRYFSAFFTKKGCGETYKKLIHKNALELYPSAELHLNNEASRLEVLRNKLLSIKTFNCSISLLVFTSSLLKEYELMKKNNALLDYDDLILFADSLLSQQGIGEWVRYKLDGGIDHLLIDEAQDTSPEQWNVIYQLASEFFSGSSGRDIKRTIFAVGDSKQSIYGFRGADPDAFSKWRRVFGNFVQEANKPWKPVELFNSFRSVPIILDLVDSVFDSPESRQGLLFDDDYEIKHNSQREGHGGFVELWPPEESMKKDRPSGWKPAEYYEYQLSASARLAHKIAKYILKLIGKEKLESQNRMIQPQDIVILVQSRTKFVESIIRELKLENIPVSGIDEKEITSFLPVMDLIGLAKFVLLPEDDLNLAAVLKGPFIGLSEDQLFSIAYGRKGTIWESLSNFAKEDEIYSRAYKILRSLIEDAEIVTPYNFFGEFLANGGRAQILERLGSKAIDSIDNFLDQSLVYERLYTSSLQGFIDWIQSENNTVKFDLNVTRNEVRIMTVHGAKGLEAPIIFLADTFRFTKGSSKILFGNNSDVPILKWSKADLKDDNLSKAYRNDEKSKKEDESRRLLYVAMTRAEDRLIVCGWKDQGKSSEDFWYFRIKNALERIDLKHENLEDGILRWTSQQINRSTLEEEKEYVNLKPLPSWVKEYPPLVKDKEVNLIAPSIQEDISENNYSPISIKSTQSFDKGLLIHKVLQFLPNIHKDSRSEILENYLEYNNLNLDKKDLAGISISVIKLINNSNFSFIFENQGLTEVPVMGKLGNRMVSGKIDRLIVTKDKILIIDYKTNINPPLDEARVPKKILRQMALYRDLICTIFPDRKVVCSLLWTEIPSLMELSDDRLNRDSLDDKGTHTYVN